VRVSSTTCRLRGPRSFGAVDVLAAGTGVLEIFIADGILLAPGGNTADQRVVPLATRGRGARVRAPPVAPAQVLEEGEVRLARADRQVHYPAKFHLVMAANPCPCPRPMTATAGARRRPGDGTWAGYRSVARPDRPAGHRGRPRGGLASHGWSTNAEVPRLSPQIDVIQRAGTNLIAAQAACDSLVYQTTRLFVGGRRLGCREANGRNDRCFFLAVAYIDACPSVLPVNIFSRHSGSVTDTANPAECLTLSQGWESGLRPGIASWER
jgi:hypothetical protein